MKQSDFRAVAVVVLGLMAVPGLSYAAGSSSSTPAAQPDLYKQAGGIARKVPAVFCIETV